MVVMTPREKWTDERLDEAFKRLDANLQEFRLEMRRGFELVDKRFEQIDKRFEQIDKRFEQIDKRFEQIDKRFEQIDARFERIDDKFFQLQRNMVTWFVGLASTIIAVLAAAILAS